MRWLNRLAYRYGKYAIKNIMSYIAGGMALVYILDYVFAMTGRLEYGTLQSLLYFNRELIFQGQVWRIITFLFIPSSSNVIFLIFAIMFYYMLGQGLEQEWGAPQLNLYLLIGYLGTLVGGFIILPNGILPPVRMLCQIAGLGELLCVQEIDVPILQHFQMCIRDRS